MKKIYAAIVGFLVLLCFAGGAGAQQQLVSDAKKSELDALSLQSHNLFLINYQKALSLAQNHGWPVRRTTKNGGIVLLQGVNSLGFPIYLATDNNTTAAATTGTNKVQPGGLLGLNLSGSSSFLNNKLAIWDGGAVYKFHQEFAGKTITLKDSSASIEHATHVSGTMIAKGVYAPAKGMAFSTATLQSYDFVNDVAEMTSAASGLLLSNHSYGDEAGWNFNDAANRWEWFGLPGDTVDYSFGFYSDRAAAWDKIAYNAPYYLIVESAGNSRGSQGPAIGSDYYGFRSRTDQTLVDKGPRPANISSNGAYDVISTTGNSKNILTVGAVNPLPSGPVNRADVQTAYFSSWGPTDDGRIKPDIVGDGVNVLSTNNLNTTSYVTLSGTSMAAPNVTGSLYLLQEYYAQKNAGVFMRSATLKGLACHTAFDAGNVGPDYIYGWGLLNMQTAAQAITDNGLKSLIKENTLLQGQQQVFNVVASGSGPLAASISWTDPQAIQTPDGTVNSRTPKLVNDLDIRVSDGATTYSPWVLDPANPGANATTGDNKVDNIEQIYIANAIAGKTYTITVAHKNTLQSGSQAYSLIVTGVGGSPYCASAPLSGADSRVDNVTLANLNYTQPAGCTTYSNHTDLTVNLEQGKTYPLNITLGTCGANFNKAAKVYVDWNNNGIFEGSELAATTGIINATGTYSANVTVPVSVIPGNFSLMRVVLTETSDTSVIKPCGNYAKGETQDYRVQFLQTNTDAGATAIVSPGITGTCSLTPQITVKIKNFGAAAISNIPVKVVITSPANTVITLNETYTGTLAPSTEDNFTLSGSFNAVTGTTYTITAETNLPNDPISANNQATGSFTISPPPVANNLSAYYCTENKQYVLSGNGDGILFWYQHIADKVPVAFGSPASTNQPPVNNTYYAGLNDLSGNIGPATKNVFAGGGYGQFTPGINVQTQVPVVIESARLYIGNPGLITFNVTDANGAVVSTTTINAAATRTNPQPGQQTDDPTDQGKIYNLNLQLPAAGVYTISVVYDANATIYRNNQGVGGYPFKIGNVFSIISNTATSPTSATDTSYYKGFYYYLYDMHVKSTGCAATARQAVTVSKPVITQTGSILNSSFSTGNQWYLNGAIIKGATNAAYSPLQSGNYQVAVTLSSGCTILSDNYNYAVVAIKPGTNTDIGLVVFPIPASNTMTIVFNAKASNDLTISIINAAGQIVYRDKQKLAAGNYSRILDVSNIPPGLYTLKLLIGQKVYGSKVIIGR
ncbi:hypothetical protein BH09BAC6_BH09BAC6_19520 [soil metagenome]|jgi:hypothetical protein